MTTIKSAVLKRVIDFMVHLEADPKQKPGPPGSEPPVLITKPLKSPNLAEMQPPLDPWYIQFVSCDQEMLYELILAANFMDIKPLLELCCARLASMIMDAKTPERIREMLGIVNDFTPEEEARVLEENKWVDEA